MNTVMSAATQRALALVPGSFPTHADLEAEPPGTPLGRLGNLIRRRWPLVLGCGLGAAILAGALGLHMPRLFTAWGQVVISPQEQQASSSLNLRSTEEAAMTIETQVSILQSRDLMARVLGDLIATPGFPMQDFAREGAGHRLLRWVVGRIEASGPTASALLGPAGTVALEKLASLPDPRQRREIIVDELLRNLKVNSEPRSRVVSVRYVAQSPALAALIVNTVINTYIAAQKAGKHDGIRESIARLDARLPGLEAELQAANAEIRAYRLDHAVPETGTGDGDEQQAIALKRAIRSTEAARAMAAERPGQAPEDAAMLAQRQQSLQRQLDQLTGGLADTQPAADRLKEMLRLMEAKRQLYEDGLLERQKLVQSQDLVTADATLLSAAAPPQKPTSTSPVLFLPPALVAGLLIGALLALWRESLDDGLRSERTIPGLLGIPCAGFVPTQSRPSGQAAGRLHDAALRFILARVLSWSARDGCGTLLVTSSVSDEGSAALAAELARKAVALTPRVILIDLEAMTRPRDGEGRAPQRHGDTRDRPVELSTSGAAVEASAPIPPSPDRGLTVLDPSQAYTLRERGLPALVKGLREDYSLIVIHAGPVLETVDARVAAAEVDQVLVAIRWGATSRRVVETAVSSLHHVANTAGKPNVIAAALTGVDVGRHLTYRCGDAIETLARAYRGRAGFRPVLRLRQGRGRSG